MYESDLVTAYWDVPVYADHTEVRANKEDARFVDRDSKMVTLLEMSCLRGEEGGREDDKVRISVAEA